MQKKSVMLIIQISEFLKARLFFKSRFLTNISCDFHAILSLYKPLAGWFRSKVLHIEQLFPVQTEIFDAFF